MSLHSIPPWCTGVPRTDDENTAGPTAQKIIATPRQRQVLNEITNHGRMGAKLTGGKSGTIRRPKAPICRSHRTLTAPAAQEAHRVHVTVRVRPLSKRELAAGAGGPNANTSWAMNASSITQMSRERAVTGNSFIFDHVFLPEADNAAVYDAVAAPVVQAAVAGINGVIFAYGQTAAGKTHTMLGTDADPGITRRSVIDLFRAIDAKTDRAFLLHASYIEIYNEVVLDLLDSGRVGLRIHEDVSNKRVYVGAHEEVVASVPEVMGILAAGERARAVGETNMNERSSRSHTIFMLRVESREVGGAEDGVVRVSTLNLVDLAGSERVAFTKAEGMRLKEGGHINKSLLTLSTVISKLSSAESGVASHIPYRDSKLTRILQPALGGNARTAVVCAVSPSSLHMDETLSTLRFASRAKKVTNHAWTNEFLDDRARLLRAEAKIKRLETENTVLRAAMREEKKAEIPAPERQGDWQDLESLRNEILALKEIVAEEKTGKERLEQELEAAFGEVANKSEKLQFLTKQYGKTSTASQDIGVQPESFQSRVYCVEFCSHCKSSLERLQSLCSKPENESPRRIEDISDLATDLDSPSFKGTVGDPNSEADVCGKYDHERSSNLANALSTIDTISDVELEEVIRHLRETRGLNLACDLGQYPPRKQRHSGWRVEGFRPRGRHDEKVMFITGRVDEIKRRLRRAGERKWAASLKSTSMRDAMAGVHTVAEEIRGRCCGSANDISDSGLEIARLIDEVFVNARWSSLSEVGDYPFVVTPRNQNDAVSALEQLVELVVDLPPSDAESVDSDVPHHAENKIVAALPKDEESVLEFVFTNDDLLPTNTRPVEIIDLT